MISRIMWDAQYRDMVRIDSAGTSILHEPSGSLQYYWTTWSMVAGQPDDGSR